MIRPLEAKSSPESSSKRRHRNETRKDQLEEFVAYMKNLKSMFDSADDFSDDYLPAICRQLSKHLTESTVSHYVCDQTCSRVIEKIFGKLDDRLKILLSGKEVDSKSVEGVNAILTTFNSIFRELAKPEKTLDFAVDQYGSHTLEQMLKFCGSALSDKDRLRELKCDEELIKGTLKCYDEICQRMLSLSNEPRNFWFLVKNPRSCHVVREALEHVKISSDASNYFHKFFSGLVEDTELRRQLHTEVYPNQHGSVTIQKLLEIYLRSTPDKNALARLSANVLPEPGVLKSLINDDSSEYGRRVIESLIENKLITKSGQQDILKSLLNLENLRDLVHTQLKPIIHKVLAAEFSFSNEQIMRLIDCASLSSNTRLIRNLILAARHNKTHARALVEKLKIIVAEDAGKTVDWAARRAAFSRRELNSIVKEENFWYMLMTAPHNSADELKYDGTSIATELIKHFKVGYLTTELVEELSLLLTPNPKSGQLESSERAAADTLSCSFFNDLVRCKHGVIFLEEIVKGSLPDGPRRMVRQAVAADVNRLCFDAHSSWLVATVLERCDPKERKSILRDLTEVRSDLRKRNPSLCARLKLEHDNRTPKRF